MSIPQEQPNLNKEMKTADSVFPSLSMRDNKSATLIPKELTKYNNTDEISSEVQILACVYLRKRA